MWGTTQPDRRDVTGVVTAVDLRAGDDGPVSVVVTAQVGDGELVTFTADCAGRCPRELARSLAGTFDLVPVWTDRSWVTGSTPRPPAARYERRT